MRRLGGTLDAGAAEVPSALDRGVVDGVFTASSGGGKIWRDLLKSSYRLGPNFFDASIAVNKTTFEKLAPNLQQRLRELVAETSPWITAELKKDETEVTQQLAAGGIAVTQASDADVQNAAKLMAPYWDEWAKSRGADATAALAKCGRHWVADMREALERQRRTAKARRRWSNEAAAPCANCVGGNGRLHFG